MCSGSRGKYVLIYRKRYKTEAYFKWKTSRKPYVTCRLVRTSMPMSSFKIWRGNIGWSEFLWNYAMLLNGNFSCCVFRLACCELDDNFCKEWSEIHFGTRVHLDLIFVNFVGQVVVRSSGTKEENDLFSSKSETGIQIIRYMYIAMRTGL